MPFPDLCLLVPFQKWLKFTIGLFQRGLISNLLSIIDFVGKCQFCDFIESTDNPHVD